MSLSYCLLLPHYNHVESFLAFLPQLLDSGMPIIVVDDGSEHAQLNKLQTALDPLEHVFLFAHPRNRGKGAASLAGLTHACALGFTHALQIDADGQHDVNDISKFVGRSQSKPNALICGQPIFDQSAPKARLYGRKITDFWVAIETLSFKVKDSLCGYRVYPIHRIEKICGRYFLSNRMDFDTDVLVKAVWSDIEIEFIPTRVRYLEHSVSHFHYLRDNILLIKLHARLMFGMALHAPKLIYRRFLRKSL